MDIMERELCEYAQNIGSHILPIICFGYSKSGVLTGVLLGWVEGRKSDLDSHVRLLRLLDNSRLSTALNNICIFPQNQILHFDLSPTDRSAMLRVFLSLVALAEYAKTRTVCEIPPRHQRTSVLSNGCAAVLSDI